MDKLAQETEKLDRKLLPDVVNIYLWFQYYILLYESDVIYPTLAIPGEF